MPEQPASKRSQLGATSRHTSPDGRGCAAPSISLPLADAPSSGAPKVRCSQASTPSSYPNVYPTTDVTVGPQASVLSKPDCRAARTKKRGNSARPEHCSPIRLHPFYTDARELSREPKPRRAHCSMSLEALELTVSGFLIPGRSHERRDPVADAHGHR